MWSCLAERGVGKTSFANTLREIFVADIPLVVKVNCDEGDDFSSIWHKAAGEIEVSENGMGFRPHTNPTLDTLDSRLNKSVSPDDVRKILQFAGETIIIFDEFDRIKKRQTNRLLADSIKNLSDNQINATVFLVGIADDVDGLFSEHGSIDRSLIEIEMPRMTEPELEEIITKAHQKLGMTMDVEAMSLTVLLSQGLPHYTHLISLNASKASVTKGRLNVTIDDVHEGIKTAVKETKQTIRAKYQQAVQSQHKDAIFSQVLRRAL